MSCIQEQPTEGVRPNARENGQIDPRAGVRVIRGAGSSQHLASVLQEGRENANIDAGLGFIWRISDQSLSATIPPMSESRIERSVRKLKDHVRYYIAGLALKGIVGSHNATSLIKYLPFRRGEDYVIPKKPAATAANGLPVPPPEQRLYGESAELHLEDGRQSWEQIVDMLQTDGKIGLHGKRILEFGCANGRLLRHFEPFAKNCEIWGVDINSKSIYWCKQNLSPPFNFVTVTTIPHLPFEDLFLISSMQVPFSPISTISQMPGFSKSGGSWPLMACFVSPSMTEKEDGNYNGAKLESFLQRP
jgi:Methyltransferase domain